MKSLWSTLVIVMLLAYLVTGNWHVKKCANRMGNCRKKCRNGEMKTEPATGMCPKDKWCCVLDIKDCGSTGNPSGDDRSVSGSAVATPWATTSPTEATA
uniref:Beta-defensin n=1 Tax=Nannospalax galili TaxID=1026970 RepID=A0A8C6QM63_NANGA